MKRRTFLKSTAAAAAGTLAVSIRTSRAAEEEKTVDIGNEVQSFLDDWIVAKHDGLVRTLHQPTKRGLLKEADGRDWDRGDIYVGHIVCRDHVGKFHMTYRYEWWDAGLRKLIGEDRAHWFRESVAYATSEDGIHWYKPKLGLIDGPTGMRPMKQFPFEQPISMSKENNLGCPIDFAYDLNAHGNIADPDKRFLIRALRRVDTNVFAEGVDRGMYYAAEWPDFVNDDKWREKLTPVPGADLSPRARNDHKTLFGYDQQTDVWFSTHQGYLPDWVKRGGRDIVRFTSPDLKQWSEPELVLPVAQDESREIDDWVEYMYLDGYRVGGPKSGAWLGQLTIFHSDRSDPEYQMPGHDGIWRRGLDEVRLVISRDAGHSWQRVFGKQTWLPCSDQPHGYDRMIYNTKEPVRVGDELWFYYPAYDGDHLIFNRDGSLYEPGFIRTTRTALATLRLDGYVSLDATRLARLVTKPLRFQGEKLLVNLKAPKGTLKAELQDLSGRPIPGFSMADCLPVRGDGVKLPVLWRDGRSTDPLADRGVRVSFELTGGSLYSFQFV